MLKIHLTNKLFVRNTLILMDNTRMVTKDNAQPLLMTPMTPLNILWSIENLLIKEPHTLEGR